MIYQFQQEQDILLMVGIRIILEIILILIMVVFICIQVSSVFMYLLIWMIGLCILMVELFDVLKMVDGMFNQRIRRLNLLVMIRVNDINMRHHQFCGQVLPLDGMILI
jgi:hypothetical protein